MTTGVLHGVLGEVAASEMRWIHPHEHLLISTGECRGETIAKYPGNVEYARRQLVGMLKELCRHGVTGLVDTTEEEWLWLATRGVRFVTTNWDFPHHMDQEEARRLVKLLIAKGHLDQILISIDFSLTMESRWCVGLWTWDNPERTSYAYLHTGVMPKLRAAGITDAHIERIMHDNPIEMLSRQ